MADLDTLPAELRLALAYTPVEHRPVLEALFRFDAMLSRFVARNTEPMLIQLRLAWWRDRLASNAEGVSSHDPLLASLRSAWSGDEAVLRNLVDAWEVQLGENAEAGHKELAAARGAALAAFARRARAPEEASRAEAVGRMWALAQFRGQSVRTGTHHLPQGRALRGLRVLGGLAERSIKTGKPMMGDRISAIVALRLGVIGR